MEHFSYWIVNHPELEECCRIVEDYLSDGWELHGSLCTPTLHADANYDHSYIQAIKRQTNGQTL